MIKTPVRGMRDIMPKNLRLREYLLGIIEQTAKNAGYQKIETPAMEQLENMSSKIGGENESLIFKVLKRGRELEKAKAENDELCDSALRYDLTVPLARYYAMNGEMLPKPFKSLQIGPVWRADAPQKGRYRQFLQCDMDILGDDSVLAEIDAIDTVMKILARICEEAKVSGLNLRINDRRILLAAATFAGFGEDEVGAALITLDKQDKIGWDGVRNELLGRGFAAEKVDKFVSLFQSGAQTPEEFCAQLGEAQPDAKVLDNLKLITQAMAGKRVSFDPSLVRGMGYYTGAIFECSADGLDSSIAGGGRYDKMIGKFSGQDVPACGFSIGFERLVAILEDLGFEPPLPQTACAILVSDKVSATKYAEILAQAEQKRQDGKIVSVLPMMRNLGRQIALLEANGYSEFEKIYGD